MPTRVITDSYNVLLPYLQAALNIETDMERIKRFGIAAFIDPDENEAIKLKSQNITEPSTCSDIIKG